MIEITLTIKQARKLLRSLSGEKSMNSAVDSDLAELHNDIAHWLGVHEARATKLPPWRKVVARPEVEHETLECGHTYTLRHSTARNAGGWIEESANKRRCQQCANEAEKAAREARAFASEAQSASV